MPRFTAVLAAKNDHLRIARALESLRACDDVLIVDHGSIDGVEATAREFGARIVPVPAGKDMPSLSQHARHDWVLCLRATEAVGESMEASLYEFGLRNAEPWQSFALGFLEETTAGWQEGPPETRIVHVSYPHWNGLFPVQDSGSEILKGHLLRLRLP